MKLFFCVIFSNFVIVYFLIKLKFYLYVFVNVEVVFYVGGINFVFILFIGKLKLVNGNIFVKIFLVINKYFFSFFEEYKYL